MTRGDAGQGLSHRLTAYFLAVVPLELPGAAEEPLELAVAAEVVPAALAVLAEPPALAAWAFRCAWLAWAPAWKRLRAAI